MKIQFVSNAAGEPTAVIIPIKEWERLQQKQPKPATKSKPKADDAPTKEQFKEDFREAVREMKRGQGRLVSELLAELDELSGQNA